MRTDGTRAEPDASRPGGRSGGTSYERYKQQLHAFFNGDKPLPDHLRTMLATRPGASEHGFAADDDEAAASPGAGAAPHAPSTSPPRNARGPRKAEGADDGGRRRVVAGAADDVQLADAIRKASSPREVQAAVDALLSRGYPLPMDADVLGKALGHSDDAVLAKALSGLLGLVGEGTFAGNATLLKTRVRNVALLSSSSAVRELCATLTARL
ncbi:MAG: hypothetical protein FJ137_07780 [Deltaproteobacteria bacterium]|nr:hypothetical protein [Deltaproteobacteria bacterium]